MSFGDLNRINTNMQSMKSQFSLNTINSRLADNQLKLSTGLRINRAEDDAAGFSIAAKLSGKLEGLEQAGRNVGNAKSMLSVAESGMNTIMDTLIEMKSKATQGANGTLGTEERGYIKNQIESLASQINMVADSTTYQDKFLLGAIDDGDVATDESASLTFQVGEDSSDTMQVDIASLRADDLFAASTDPADPADGALSAVSDGTVPDTGPDPEGITLENANAETFRAFIGEIDAAINTVAGSFNQIGIDQNALSIRQESLSQSVISNSAARSRIQDADFAKVQSESIKLQIMQQTAIAALAQANSSPQAVLGFLR